MEQIKLIGKPSGSFAIPELEREANQWLKDNADKQVVHISIVSHPSDPTAPDLSPKGWMIMIRYQDK